MLLPHVATLASGHSSPRYRVVIDTNVWVSGLLYGGNSEEVIRLVMSHHELVCSEYILEELIEHLKLERPKISVRFIRKLRLSIEQYLVQVDVVASTEIRDPKDEPIVALAQVAEAMIVTGDKDFLEYRGELGVAVSTVNDAVLLFA